MLSRDGSTRAPNIRTRHWPTTKAVRKPRATRVQQLSRTEIHFKKVHSNWDRLRREFAFVTRHGTTTSGIYRWIFGYDPVTEWRGA